MRPGCSIGMSTRHMGIIAHTLRRKGDTMLYWLSDGSDKILVFNVFRYLTIRAGGALVTALVFMVLFGPSMINLLLGNRGENQAIRSDDLSSQTIVKAATLTMLRSRSASPWRSRRPVRS